MPDRHAPAIGRTPTRNADAGQRAIAWTMWWGDRNDASFGAADHVHLPEEAARGDAIIHRAAQIQSSTGIFERRVSAITLSHRLSAPLTTLLAASANQLI